MSRLDPADYPDRASWIAALIEQADRLNKEAQALPLVPDPPRFPWQVA